MCILFQKYCGHQQPLIPQKNNAQNDTQNTTLNNIQTTVELIRQNEEKIIELLIEQNNNMNKIINLDQIYLQDRIIKLDEQIKVLRKKEREFLELSEKLKYISQFTTPSLIGRYKQKDAECETYKNELKIAQQQLIAYTKGKNNGSIVR